MLANKVKDDTNEQFGVSNLAEAKELDFYTAKAAAAKKANQLGEDLAQKALLRASARVTKSRLRTRKLKEILSNLLVAKPLTDISIATMSNVPAGS